MKHFLPPAEIAQLTPEELLELERTECEADRRRMGVIAWALGAWFVLAVAVGAWVAT